MDEIAPTLTAPVVYLPLVTAVCSLSVGVTVVPACVDNCEVLLPDTVIVPAVPEETYPSLTDGVTLLVALVVEVISPEEDTLIEGFAVMVVAGVDALPLATLLLALSA